MPAIERLPELGRRIQALRESRGFTQRKLANLLDTSQSAIARIERGEQNLTAEMVTKIERALHKNLVTLASDTNNFRIRGGKKLSGAVTIKTSKNSATALLVASLLNRGTTTLKCMPHIEEVNRIIEVLQSIGVSIRWVGDDVEITPPRAFTLKVLDDDAARKTRSVILLIGPLIHRLEEFSLPHVGGCKLGLRSIKPHLAALQNFGITISKENGYYRIKRKKLSSAYVVLSEAGDTVTENALMVAARTPGLTTIKYASANYQVQDLCFYLQALGVEIKGVGTTTLVVRGKEHIDTDITFYPSEDPTEAMFFLATAATTNAALTLARCPIEFLELELLTLAEMGFRYKMGKPYRARNGKTLLVDIVTAPSRLTAPAEKIAPRPYPGLNIDNLPFFAVIATQARGKTFIHDWVYEKRAIYYTELDKLGAETLLADPHRIYITGPTKLTAAEVVCPPALRPATILLIGMLAAEGTSILRNVYSINRGYEDLVKRLRAVGADIEILTGAL